MVTQITDYLLYRWRYILGYGLVVACILGLLTVALLYIPGGLSAGEMESVVTSTSFAFSLEQFNPQSVINLPYHLLQRGSIELLGLTPLGVKLPSFVLGVLSALGILLLLRNWFKQNIAVLTTILVITTGQFIFLTQSGTPAIVYIFWPVWLLVAALMVSRRSKLAILWKIALFGIAALSLYTPLTIYILIALLSSIILHPHLRFLVKQLPKVKLMIGFTCALLLLAPLIYALILQPGIAMPLLGVPEAWPNLVANGNQLLRQYFDFVTPNSGIIMTPIYGLGTMILIGLGLLRLFTTKYTARSYITIAWIALLLPVIIVNPNFISITFIPGVLLMAMGTSWLLTRWYKLFPRNPYARIAGLVPLVVLIGGMVFSGVDRFVYGYLYDPKTAINFTTDLDLINAQLADETRGSTLLVVAPTELAFYATVAKYNKDTTASTTPNVRTATIIASREASGIFQSNEPWRIVANATSENSNRFYIYKNPSQ